MREGFRKSLFNLTSLTTPLVFLVLEVFLNLTIMDGKLMLEANSKLWGNEFGGYMYCSANAHDRVYKQVNDFRIKVAQRVCEL